MIYNMHVNWEKTYTIFTRLSFFIIYFWFGLLKVIDKSSATPLVEDLFVKLFSTEPSSLFFVLFGTFEMYIGILFLIPKLTVTALVLVSLHLLATFLPLFLLPNHTWTDFGALGVEGQYILKNMFIISSVIGLWISYTKKVDSNKDSIM